MPTYEYACPQCKKKFNVSMTIQDHDRRRIKCPKCANARVNQTIQGFFTTTSKKS